MKDRYTLYYWPGIPGRGEFVRLAFEDAGAAYDDVGRRSAKEGGGVPALMRALEPAGAALTPFALPVLHHGDVVVAQTAAILMYVAPRIGVVPVDEASRLRAHQIQLTIADLCAEIHDAHHPIASSLYYEDQKREAARRTPLLLTERLPKYFRYLSGALEGRPWLLGDACSYVDLSVFHVVAGLRFAFPRALPELEAAHPRLAALHDDVAARPRIAAYLASPRRVAFNEHGLFRHYPALDAGARPPRPAPRKKTAAGRRRR